MEIIYGSSAIKFWYPDYKGVPKDIDIICDDVNKKTTKQIEYHWMEEFNYLKDNNHKYLRPNLLYTLKLSHLSYDIKWDKHMRDVIFLKNKGCEIDIAFYYILMNAWERIHGKKKVKMNVNNDVFFKENIERKYSHDWLHEQFAFYERPLNERIRKDLNSPLCSKDLWNKLSYEDKIKTALEEIYVLSFERILSREDNKRSIEMAKIITLKQMIISTTSGWFNLFLKENFKELLENKPIHILNRIKTLF